MNNMNKLMIMLLVTTSTCAMEKRKTKQSAQSALAAFQKKCAERATRTENDSPLFWGKIYDPAYNLLLRVTPTAALQSASDKDLEVVNPA